MAAARRGTEDRGAEDIGARMAPALALLNLAWFASQVNFFVAVTQQQVICYGVAYSLSRRSGPAVWCSARRGRT